jgi:DNA replication protein DnaC
VTVLRPVPSADSGLEQARCALGACDGSGWILDEGTNTARPCDCRERRANQAVTGWLGTSIPKRLREVSFDRKPICDLERGTVRHVRAFVREIDANLDAGKGLWFHGDVGTGKTSLALLLAKAAGDAGRSVAIYSVPLLLAELKNTYERDSAESYMQLFRRLSRMDLLVLDDLGAEKQTEWVLEQLYSLVNERWQDQSSIVVTTNTPDPHRDAPLLQRLRNEVEELGKRREGGRSQEELREVVERLERTTERLENLALLDDTAAVPRLRQQIGTRTVSRLVEICDDPISIMGPDLRVTAGGA